MATSIITYLIIKLAIIKLMKKSYSTLQLLRYLGSLRNQFTQGLNQVRWIFCGLGFSDQSA